MMKVLTSDAVQDPTKLEKRIVREVELRALKHEQDNAERKLSKDERREKEYAKLNDAEAKNGLQASVYLIRYLTNGRHKFKVRKTAEHDLLTGLTIFAPTFALVVVEGVAKKIKHYRQLMTSRIDWTEEPRAQGAASDSDSEDEEKEGEADGPDMSKNRCEVIWEGEIPERTFTFFRARHAETDSEGKNYLGPKYEGLWDFAKRKNWDEDVY
jgi:U4/U6 small nuclear ribonucleoprotein PRP3